MSSSLHLTPAQLMGCMPRLHSLRAASLLPFLLGAMEEAEINTPQRAACFLAQLGHESCSLKYTEEVWGPTAQQRRYEPPSSLARRLGNTQPGDGKLFKGRGPIQITGRKNYRLCGKALNLDLENHPEYASQPDVGFRIAGWFWTTGAGLNLSQAARVYVDPGCNLNDLADKGLFDCITWAVNGGQNGADDRMKRFKLAQRVLSSQNNQPVV